MQTHFSPSANGNLRSIWKATGIRNYLHAYGLKLNPYLHQDQKRGAPLLLVEELAEPELLTGLRLHSIIFISHSFPPSRPI